MRQFELRVRVASERILLEFNIQHSTFTILYSPFRHQRPPLTFLPYRGNTISAQMGLWSDKGFLSSIIPPSVTLAPAEVLYKM